MARAWRLEIGKVFDDSVIASSEDFSSAITNVGGLEEAAGWVALVPMWPQAAPTQATITSMTSLAANRAAWSWKNRRVD